MREDGYKVSEKKKIVEKRMTRYWNAESNVLAHTHTKRRIFLWIYLTQYNFCYVSISPKEKKLNLIYDSLPLSTALSKLHRLKEEELFCLPWNLFMLPILMPSNKCCPQTSVYTVTSELPSTVLSTPASSPLYPYR